MIIPLPSLLPRADRTRQSQPELFGNDPQSFRSDFTERRPGVPQILLVEQPVEGSTVLTHYHSQDQFQVFIEGAGTLGRHAVNPVTVHYTNRYTGYGPIVDGPRGVSYYVLRPSFDTLVTGQYVHVPELRDKLKRHPGPKRSIVVNAISTLGDTEMRALQEVRVQRVIEVRPQDVEAGLFADVIILGPGMRYRCPDPAGGGGQVALVLAGEILHEGARFGCPSGVALTRDAAAVELVAMEGGAQVLLMQYPRRPAEGV